MNKFPANQADVHTYANPEMPMVHQIHQYLGCQEPLTLKFISACLTAIQIFDYKQRNYGSRNIAKVGVPGVLTRMSDKVERLINIQSRGIEPQDETVEDSFGDAAVYGLIALMIRWGWWPGVEKEDGKKT